MQNLKTTSGKFLLDSPEFNLILRPAKDEDKDELYDNLQMDDIEECLRLGLHPRHAIEESFRDSLETFSCVNRETHDLICCFGVTKQGSVGVLWFLGTFELDKFTRQFVKLAPKAVEYLLKDFEIGTNIISGNNEKRLRFVNFLGAVFVEPDSATKLIPKNFRQFVIKGGMYDQIGLTEPFETVVNGEKSYV